MQSPTQIPSSETQFPIAQEGFLFIGIGASLLLYGAAEWGWIGVLLFGIPTLFCIYFFRDPRRKVPQLEGRVLSPADGVVVNVAQVEEGRFLKKPAIQISIFLNVFNVHVNRIPVTGKIIGIFYQKGQFLPAYLPKASLDNEHNALLIETASGKRVVCTQIAGLIARRIVCRAKEGMEMHQGQRYGIIKFGSRVDLFLPIETHIKVSKGSKVVGGETILGELK